MSSISTLSQKATFAKDKGQVKGHPQAQPLTVLLITVALLISLGILTD